MGNCLTTDGHGPSVAHGKLSRIFRMQPNGHHGGPMMGGIHDLNGSSSSDHASHHHHLNGSGLHSDRYVPDLVTGDLPLPLRSTSGHSNSMNLLHEPITSGGNLFKSSDNKLSNLVNNNNSNSKLSQINNHLKSNSYTTSNNNNNNNNNSNGNNINNNNNLTSNNNNSNNNNGSGLDQQKQQRIMICLTDFVATCEGDLSVKKGERLMVTFDGTTPDWCRATSLKTQLTGFVPRNYLASEAIEMEEWFFPLSRREAEKLLLSQNNCRGTFLVRNSEEARTGYSLSIRDHDQEKRPHVKHYKVKTLDNGGYFVATRNTFKTMSELISFYSKAPSGLCHKLVRPCPKPKPSFWPDRGDEINRAELRTVRKIGTGCFGEVYYGTYRKSKEVAIKTLKQGTMSPQAFLEEAVIMRRCRHPNLVPLYGVCSQEEPLLIVTEFMCNGSLLEYLRNNPEGKRLNLNELMDMASQIACGMAYLEQEKLIHRDLAARNILVGENRVVKVADFGLARVIEDSEYTARQGAKFPIKWTAPEAAMYGKFSIKSDVWSYGILLYELVTHGSIPYAGMHNKEVIEQVQHGFRLPRPTNCDCPDKVYGIMLDCWQSDPDKRPTFEFLAAFFDNYAVSAEQSYRDASDCF